jgi:hypothetical protein
MSESSIAAIAIERKLPEELLASIVSLISPQCLRNLCRTCKTFSRIATPYLYAHVSLGQQVDYSSDYKQSPALVRFAYTIFSSPKYADLVKTVTVSDAWGVPGEYREVEPTSWPASGLELNEVLRKKCTEYAATEEGVDELYEKIASGENEDAILALLLASLPKLANLDINFGFHEEHSDFLKLLESSMDRVKLDKDSFPGFSVPVNVMVKGTDDKHPNNPVVMARMSRLPNIRALYGWKMGDSDGNWTAEGNHFATLKPRSCSVEYVELRDSKLHNRNLQLLLDATIPGTLKTFNYEIGCTWAWCNVQHLSIMASLRAHHDTLDSLGLSHEEFYPYQFGNEAEEPYPVTFKPFKVLTRLKIAPVYIWGDANLQDHASWTKTETHNMLCEALPESLQELWITRAEPQHSNPDATAAQFIPDCLLPALQLVIQQKSQICPKLRQLRIEFPLMNWDREWISLLASVCAEADTNGIRTTLRLTGLPRSIDDEKDDRERPWGWDEKVHWEKCVHNQESPKRWIQVGEQKCLGEMLLDLRAQLFELIGTITVAD